ncbi:MAG: DUF1501 domain-containing protein [Aureliella sp.]
MMLEQRSHSCGRVAPLLTRRAVLQTTGLGFGWLALQGLMNAAAAAEVSRSPQPHFAPRAKRVIFLCMRGAPSHVDTFDYKPQLQRDDGRPGRRPGTKLLGSPWQFSQHGDGGLWISELFPHVAKEADKLCLLRSLHTDLPAHPQAVLRLHTGTSQFVRPSLGAWTLYGLGSENENLPGFVTLTPPTGFGGAQNYGSGFLPAAYQATRIGSDNRPVSTATLPYLEPLAGKAQQQVDLGLTERFNRAQRAHQPHDADIDGVIQSFELAFKMQSELPRVLDLDSESSDTQQMYGIGQRTTDDFGRKCLMARRLVEAGVRFVEITHGNWDQHFNLKQALQNNCDAVDLPIAGLLRDLEARGLLKDTLVLWSGEFGRTPHAQGDDGRDHNNQAFTSWMAGGGVKGGFAYGSSDEHGYEAVDSPMSIHDLHATILHLLGLDHQRLTYRYAGRDFRLTDVYGNVAQEIMA